MASPAAPADLGAMPAPAAAATRDIMMWTNETKQDTKIKFHDVPLGYSLEDIKHADHLGMFWFFNNGEGWLTLKNKRLFRLPDYAVRGQELGPESPDDLPVMQPDELRKVLASGEFPSYEEVHALWLAAQQRMALSKRAAGGSSDTIAT